MSVSVGKPVSLSGAGGPADFGALAPPPPPPAPAPASAPDLGGPSTGSSPSDKKDSSKSEKENEESEPEQPKIKEEKRRNSILFSFYSPEPNFRMNCRR